MNENGSGRGIPPTEEDRYYDGTDLDEGQRVEAQPAVELPIEAFDDEGVPPIIDDLGELYPDGQTFYAEDGADDMGGYPAEKENFVTKYNKEELDILVAAGKLKKTDDDGYALAEQPDWAKGRQ